MAPPTELRQRGPDTAPADAEPPPVLPLDPETLPPAALHDVTKDYGIDPDQVHGICAAAADLDGNGREDFVVIERDKAKAKIRAVLLGGAAKHVISPFDTTLLVPTTACSLVDMNGDGKPDLLVGGQSGAALYLGDGQGGFADHSAEWLPDIMDFSAWSVLPVDLDGDGDLDLFIGAGSPSFDPGNPGPGPACGSTNCGYFGTDFTCQLVTQLPDETELQDRVLIRGAKLPMQDATKAWNVPPGGLLSAGLALDVDGDGKQDVFVCDDFGGHRLLHNLGGSFAVHDTDLGFYPYAHGMGWGMGDFDGDGRADLILADVGPNPVYVQQDPVNGLPVQFSDAGGTLGLWGPTWSASTWSPLVEDFDQDGHDDVYLGSALNTTPDKLAAVTAGCTVGGKLPFTGYANVDLLFLRKGNQFKAFRLPSGKDSHFNAIAQVALDLDDDGDLDLVQSRPNANLTSRIRILRNDVASGGFARVVLQGKGQNRDAIGSVVRGKVAGQLRTRWLSGSSGYGAARARIAQFGLGAAGAVQNVEVTWPDGKKSNVGDVKAGATVTVKWL